MSSSQRICCDVNGSRLLPKKPKSALEIIFSWDKFNTISLAIVILLFTIWVAVYFNVYKPAPNDGMSGHHSHGGGHSQNSKLSTTVIDDLSATESVMEHLF